MPRKSKKELTEEELEMIHWRATRGCHFDVTFLPESLYVKQVIEEDVPLLIAEIRRLRAVEHVNAADGEYVLVEDNDEMYGTGPHRLVRSRRR